MMAMIEQDIRRAAEEMADARHPNRPFGEKARENTISGYERDLAIALPFLIDPERRALEQAVLLQSQKLVDGDSLDLVDLRRALAALDAQPVAETENGST
jgi:hypothetical protein